MSILKRNSRFDYRNVYTKPLYTSIGYVKEWGVR